MSFDTLTTVYVSNAIGIVLLATLIFSNRGMRAYNQDINQIFKIVWVAMLSCIVDPIMYTVDGRQGILYTIIIYVGNSWIYLANILVADAWLKFLSNHLNRKISGRNKLLLDAMMIFGVISLIINLFYPIVFSVENNVYKRGVLYWSYVAMAGIWLLNSVYLYMDARKKGGILKFYPVDIFISPIVIGVVVQSVFYGISVIWVSISVAAAGAMMALQNQVIFSDKLTGIYNRTYLDYIQQEINRRRNISITGVMIDLNGFKEINDQHGHAEGDEALIITADILKSTVGELGNVIRYAGDEFVLLLNTDSENKVQEIIDEIRQRFVDFNKRGEKPYHITASMGSAVMNPKSQTINDFMNTIDKMMYEDKASYYRKKAIKK